jgi:hypothetical protein
MNIFFMCNKLPALSIGLKRITGRAMEELLFHNNKGCCGRRKISQALTSRTSMRQRKPSTISRRDAPNCKKVAPTKGWWRLWNASPLPSRSQQHAKISTSTASTISEGKLSCGWATTNELIRTSMKPSICPTRRVRSPT